MRATNININNEIKMNENKKLPSYLNSRDSFSAIRSCVAFNFIPKHNFPETEPLIDEIMTKLMVKSFNYRRYKTYVQTIIINLANAAYQGKGMSFFKNAHHWADVNKKLNLTEKISYRKLSHILDIMEDMGYLIRIVGNKNVLFPELSYASRYFASNALVARLKEEWCNYMADDERLAIRLNNANKEDITPDTLPAEIESVKEEVDEINDFLSKQFITAETPHTKCVCIKSGDEPEFRMKSVREQNRFFVKLQAIYKHNFELGGRLYALCRNGKGNYQGFSSNYNGEADKIDRKSIKINGLATCEVDYKCLHINLAYNLCNKQFSGDAYDIDGYNRKTVKRALLIMLNSKSYNKAIKTVMFYDSLEYYEAKDLIDAIMHKHEPLKQLLFSNNTHCFGLELQNIDSMIMRDVLIKLKNLNIPALPVHDSVICPHSYRRVVEKIMTAVYKLYMGYDITVETK
jgi:hypothetical protein